MLISIYCVCVFVQYHQMVNLTNLMKCRHLLNVITTKLVILISHHRHHERDYTTASNICLRISNKEYCSTRLLILISNLGPRKPWCKFKSSAAPVAIKSDNYTERLRGP